MVVASYSIFIQFPDKEFFFPKQPKDLDPSLTHSYLETLKRVIGKHADLDQMPHDVASDQGLIVCSQDFPSKNRIKATK